MDAKELLKTWPGWARANAARVLASPAWRLEARYGGRPAVLRRQGGDVPSDASGRTISLEARFDDTERIVTFAPSPLFPDLWELRDHLAGLPAEILLALVEKECGEFFRFFEDLSRKTLSIRGLAGKPAPGTSFVLATDAGEVSFSVTLSPEVEQMLGQVSNLDETHESIRSLTREITATAAVLEMSDADVDALRPGDCLVLAPEAAPVWELEVPADGSVRLVSPETREVTFAEIADGALGPVPEAERVNVVCRGRVRASGVFATLGAATVVRIDGGEQGTKDPDNRT